MTHNQQLPIVPWSEWYNKLELCGPDDINRIPALKLLPFYRSLAAGDSALRTLDKGEAANREALGFVTLATDKMQVISSTLRELPSLEGGDSERWITYWQSKGLLPKST